MVFDYPSPHGSDALKPASSALDDVLCISNNHMMNTPASSLTSSGSRIRGGFSPGFRYLFTTQRNCHRHPANRLPCLHGGGGEGVSHSPPRLSPAAVLLSLLPTAPGTCSSFPASC